MNNSLKKSKNLITPENAASFLPIIISTGIGILIIVFFVMPEFIKSNKVNLELNEFIRKKDDLENLKFNYKKISKELNDLNNQKLRIIELISGTSNLDTLLANIGILGRKNNIEFLSIVPQKLLISNDNQSLNNNNKPNLEIDPDPLLVDGLKKYLIDFSFKTDFINLLSFLRDLEFQENIILINDIDVKVLEDNNNNVEKLDNNNLNVKLSMTFYGEN